MAAAPALLVRSPELAQPLRCGAIMRRPAEVIGAGARVIDAARRMRELDLGFLPVVGEDGVVVGILTDRDIVTRVCAIGSSIEATPVRAAMSADVFGCAPEAPLSRARALMKRHRVTRVVILDEARRPAGVVSLSDIAQYAPLASIGRTLRAVSERKYGSERP